METRRIRRRERQRAHRIAALAVSVGVLCVAIGMALPHSVTASMLLFAAAACCLVVLVLRDETRAPLHGLRRVVRLPVWRSLAVTSASFGARVVGTFHAAVGRRFQPTPIAADEDDDEAEAWWGASSAELAPLPLMSAVPDAEPDAEPTPTPVLEPVLAAPMQSAHVPATESRMKVGTQHAWLAVRAHVDGLVKKTKRSGRGEFTAST
jgi:hypothetical protein